MKEKYFTELVWHNIREFLYGARPFGFFRWKSFVYKALKDIKINHYPYYYWSGVTIHIYGKNGMIDYNIYKVLTFSQYCKNSITPAKLVNNIFIDKKYKDEFSKTLKYK